jgi:hypothetical protein
MSRQPSFVMVVLVLCGVAAIAILNRPIAARSVVHGPLIQFADGGDSSNGGGTTPTDGPGLGGGYA